MGNVSERISILTIGHPLTLEPNSWRGSLGVKLIAIQDHGNYFLKYFLLKYFHFFQNMMATLLNFT